MEIFLSISEKIQVWGFYGLEDEGKRNRQMHAAANKTIVAFLLDAPWLNAYYFHKLETEQHNECTALGSMSRSNSITVHGILLG